MSKSAEILESWREKAREESYFESYRPRYITGFPEVDLAALEEPYQVIVLEAD